MAVEVRKAFGQRIQVVVLVRDQDHGNISRILYNVVEKSFENPFDATTCGNIGTFVAFHGDEISFCNPLALRGELDLQSMCIELVR
jgi:hypothetical protein